MINKVKFTEMDGLVVAGTGQHITCPMAYDQERGSFNGCSTACAWFKLVEEYGIPLKRNICLCKGNIIGQLDGN